MSDVLACVPRPQGPLHRVRQLEARMSDIPTSGLLDAMLALQGEVPKLHKDATNPAFKSKYVTLDSVMDAVGPLLLKHQLVWTTLPVSNEHGQPALYYRLAHTPTGEEIAGTMPLLLSKQDPQGLGSALTYSRRQSICAVLNLVADDDDDGHRASQRRPAGASSDAPSEAQLKELSRQVKRNQPLESSTLAACLLSVGAKDITGDDLESGAWATKINRAQVSGLIDLFKDGTLPTGGSDVPADAPEFEPAGEGEGDDVPFS